MGLIRPGRNKENTSGGRSISKGDKTIEDGEEKGGHKDASSNMTLTMFNVCNSMLGAGVIVMPFALMEAGFGLGIILLVAAAGITDYSLCLLIHAGELAKRHTYIGTTKVAFGQAASMAVLMWAFCYPIVIMTSYNIIIGDMSSRLLIRVTHIEDIDDLRNQWWGRRELLILLFVVTTQLPLSLYKNISSLAKWAALSLVSLVIIVILMMVRLVELDLPDTPGAYVFAKFDALQALGIISSAYFCHHSSFIMYRSMSKPTEKRWDEVVHISLFVSLAAILAVGIIGYATFTEDTQGDILQNYCSSDDLANAARFMFIITLIISYPVELFVARNIIEDVFFHECKEHPIPLRRHVLVTLSIISVTYGLSLITECIGFVLEIAGLFLAIPLAYFFPPLLVMKLTPHPICHHKNIPRITLMLVAAGVFVGGWYETIRELVAGEVGCSAGAEPDFCLNPNATII